MLTAWPMLSQCSVQLLNKPPDMSVITASVVFAFIDLKQWQVKVSYLK